MIRYDEKIVQEEQKKESYWCKVIDVTLLTSMTTYVPTKYVCKSKQVEYRQFNVSVDYFLAEMGNGRKPGHKSLNQLKWILHIFAVKCVLPLKSNLISYKRNIFILFHLKSRPCFIRLAHETFMVDWLEAICSSKSIFYSPWTYVWNNFTVSREKAYFLLHFLFHFFIHYSFNFVSYNFLLLRLDNETKCDL